MWQYIVLQRSLIAQSLRWVPQRQEMYCPWTRGHGFEPRLVKLRTAVWVVHEPTKVMPINWSHFHWILHNCKYSFNVNNTSMFRGNCHSYKVFYVRQHEYWVCMCSSFSLASMVIIDNNNFVRLSNWFLKYNVWAISAVSRPIVTLLPLQLSRVHTYILQRAGRPQT